MFRARANGEALREIILKQQCFLVCWSFKDNTDLCKPYFISTNARAQRRREELRKRQVLLSASWESVKLAVILSKRVAYTPTFRTVSE